MQDWEREERERADAQEAKRRARDDWFARQLGEGWVESEPGIYMPPAARPEPPPVPKAEPEALIEQLLDELPRSGDQESAPHEHPTDDLSAGFERRGWFHRR